MKLIDRWGYIPEDFPRLNMMRKQAALSWAIKEGETDMCLVLGAIKAGLTVGQAGEVMALRKWAMEKIVKKHGEAHSCTVTLVKEWDLQGEYPGSHLMFSLLHHVHES